MKYREFINEQTKIVERIGDKKYNIIQRIFKETNGKISFKEALEIVSKISDDEINTIQLEVSIISNPNMMAFNLVMANREIDKVLFGKCEFIGFDEADFELNDRLVVLIKGCIYIYIPNGEY